MVGENVSFADLNGVIADFLRSFLIPDDSQVRFRPSFSLTEPSAEIDVPWLVVQFEGRWLDVAGRYGASRRSSYLDPEPHSGFGLGQIV